MSFFEIIGAIIIGPLKLVFEILYNLAYKLTLDPGLSIIALSLAMNILVLPLYRRADAMQEEARDIDAKLRRGVNHIKKSFSSDERMMILQTYYRQNDYRPTDALNGSVSLLLEIPFFIAAYQFLSHLSLMEGVTFGPIADLAKPDGLLAIGGITINLLPVLMTLINVVSSAIYLKGFPLKTKVQLYGMAAFFLVFLYNSPAGLVFYWTLNNLFSLVKTIFYKIKNPGKVLAVLCAAVGLGLLYFDIFMYVGNSFIKKAFLFVVGLSLLIPVFMPLLNRLVRLKKQDREIVPDKQIFMLGGLFITVLLGALIPSTFISASTQEFIDPDYFYNPIWYVVCSSCVAAGFFLLWFGVFRWLANSKGKRIFEALMLVLCGVMLVDYMFFGTDLGVISATLQYETDIGFSSREIIMNLAVLAVVAGLMLLLLKKPKAVKFALLTATAALLVMSASQSIRINREARELKEYTQALQQEEYLGFPLSKRGQNVVILMMDRAMGDYLPYIFEEKPELEEKFAGFTYYSNVISYGDITNIGVPAIYGGYEYTPVEMNRRADESLRDKHNEALKVMPVIFSENGFDVTVSDPPYANYKWIPDLSIFADIPGVRAINTDGKFDDSIDKAAEIAGVKRNFFVLSVMKTLPAALQRLVYDGGNYNNPGSFSVQVVHDIYTAQGENYVFMNAYKVMENLRQMTAIRDDEVDTMLVMSNVMTHEPSLLQMPDYKPAERVDNHAYESFMSERELNGRKLRLTNAEQVQTYHVNVAAYLLIADWLDYLRENQVYDNTRIIIVADHGRKLWQMDELEHSLKEGGTISVDAYYPLLLVKDFGAKEFSVSDEFMTNADVPWLAMEGLIDNPVNPFTGLPINDTEKLAHDQYICLSSEWDVNVNNGNTFLPSAWAGVKDNIWDEANWTLIREPTVLREHALP
ncbi:MAG: YidC/Oxa1 family membrane protein insertase [Oscillospiraceae bacterium]|nr:YidC/Oxa1 family membrane protein insertase [Oscillospiraceae bacterium]